MASFQAAHFRGFAAEPQVNVPNRDAVALPTDKDVTICNYGP